MGRGKEMRKEVGWVERGRGMGGETALSRYSPPHNIHIDH